MEVRRKEPETRVLDRELTTRLRDAALAQNQRLPAFGQRPANDRPFLEGIVEHPALATAFTPRRFIDYGLRTNITLARRLASHQVLHRGPRVLVLVQHAIYLRRD